MPAEPTNMATKLLARILMSYQLAYWQSHIARLMKFDSKNEGDGVEFSQ